MTAEATRGEARAVADVSEGMLLATVEIAAPPERVFRALASEELVRHEGFDGRRESCEGHTEGWRGVLGWLRAYFGQAATSAKGSRQ